MPPGPSLTPCQGSLECKTSSRLAAQRRQADCLGHTENQRMGPESPGGLGPDAQGPFLN